MNILFISPTYSGAGGIGPHAFRVAEKLRENNFDVELMQGFGEQCRSLFAAVVDNDCQG